MTPPDRPLAACHGAQQEATSGRRPGQAGRVGLRDATTAHSIRAWLRHSSLHAMLLIAMCSHLAAQPLTETRRSGFDMMSPQTQAMQRDDSLNPAWLWVKEGEALWPQREGPLHRSCESCHADPKASMHGVAARYPQFDAQEQRAVNIARRINLCRQRYQQIKPLATESGEQLGLMAFIASLSRGLPISPPSDPALLPIRNRGEAIFQRRIGQLNLACSSCHDGLAGRRLGASPIPPADVAPYPAYRLEWQALGSLQRRIRNCMTGVRAEAFGFDSEPMIELELYLVARSRGLAFEAPGVRP